MSFLSGDAFGPYRDAPPTPPKAGRGSDVFQVAIKPKKVSEEIFVPFNFADQAVFGEVLSSPVVTVTLFSGVDYNPSAILNGAAVVNGTIVTQEVIGGAAGVVYILTATVNGQLGRIYKATQYVSVLTSQGFAQDSLPSLTGTLPNAIIGVPYSANLAISGGYAPYSPIGLIAGAPPWMGFTVVNNTLVCAGLPDVATSYSFAPKILDSGLNLASSPQNITVAGQLAITGNLPDGAYLDAVNYQYIITGGTPPYTVTIDTGSLPTGVTINNSALAIGSLNVVNTFNWTVKVVDSSVPQQQATVPDSCTVVNLTTLLFAYNSGTGARAILASADGSDFTNIRYQATSAADPLWNQGLAFSKLFSGRLVVWNGSSSTTTMIKSDDKGFSWAQLWSISTPSGYPGSITAFSVSADILHGYSRPTRLSQDNGLTFPLNGRQEMSYGQLSPSSPIVVGAGGSSFVSRSNNGGVTFATVTPTPGFVSFFGTPWYATDGVFLYFGCTTGAAPIIQRTTNGDNWFTETLPAGVVAPRTVEGMAYGNGIYVAALDDGTLIFKTGGVWSIAASNMSLKFVRDLIFNGTNFICVASGGTGGIPLLIKYSANGNNWSTAPVPAAINTYAASDFVVLK